MGVHLNAFFGSKQHVWAHFQPSRARVIMPELSVFGYKQCVWIHFQPSGARAVTLKPNVFGFRQRARIHFYPSRPPFTTRRLEMSSPSPTCLGLGSTFKTIFIAYRLGLSRPSPVCLCPDSALGPASPLMG